MLLFMSEQKKWACLPLLFRGGFFRKNFYFLQEKSRMHQAEFR